MRSRIRICVAMGLAVAGTMLCLAQLVQTQELRVPSAAVAGEDTAISTTGSGKATFYLSGPGVSRKQDVALGEGIRLTGGDLKIAGEYVAILCSRTCASASFYLNAGKPASLTFLVHPSRVPVAQSDAVSGVAFPFDQFHNLALAPHNVQFQLAAKDVSPWSRSERTQNGVAWFRATSGRSAGQLQVTASLDDLSAKRAVQQVASDPCNLRITGQRTKSGIMVQTEPVHDCSGNVVPDGTIVTFTAAGSHGTGTVDAPVKQGIARAQMNTSDATVISAASGVVMGNEIRIGAQP